METCLVQWMSSEIKLRKSHCTGHNPKPYAGAYYIIRTNKGSGNIDENPDIKAQGGEEERAKVLTRGYKLRSNKVRMRWLGVFLEVVKMVQMNEMYDEACDGCGIVGLVFHDPDLKVLRLLEVSDPEQKLDMRLHPKHQVEFRIVNGLDGQGRSDALLLSQSLMGDPVGE